MEILGLEKVSFVDYEGFVCATIFTGGCNFRCPFCHNSTIVNKEQTVISEQEVLDYLKQRKKLLDAVTISGGEPTLQKDLGLFIKKIKAFGYKIKLDTNGTFPNVVKSLVDENLLDYVAIDIKTCFQDYPLVSGIKNNYSSNIKETLQILKSANVSYELRTTLVKEFHSQSVVERMKEELKGEGKLYLQKFVDSGSCIGNNLHEVDKETALKYLNILSETIDEVVLRGYN